MLSGAVNERLSEWFGGAGPWPAAASQAASISRGPQRVGRTPSSARDPLVAPALCHCFTDGPTRASGADPGVRPTSRISGAADLSAGSVLVIGCGNIDRGDDAAGILVARRLREHGIPALEHSRDGLALMESWAGAERVILIDAVQTGSPPGAVTEWDGRTVPVSTGAAGTHGFGVAEAIQLARVLDRLPPSLAIFGIEAAGFTPGQPPCPEVEFAIGEVARRIILEVEHA